MKKSPKKLLVIATSIGIGSSIFSAKLPVYANSEIETSFYDSNFKPKFRPTDKEEAKIYSEKRYEEWSKDFSSKEKRLVQSFKKNSPTNELLRKYRGNIIRMKRDSTDPKLAHAVSEIDEMNRIIKKPENLTLEKQIVYTRFSATDFGYESNSDLGKGLLDLDMKHVNNFKRGFQYGKFPDLRLGSLTEGTDGLLGSFFSKERILVELTVPKGTYMGHLGDGQIIFPSDYAMRLVDKNITVIKQNGKNILKLNAKVVKKVDIEEEILHQQNVINKVVAMSLRAKGISDKDIENINNKITFNFTGLNASLAVKNSQKSILDLVNNDHMPANLIKDCFLKLQKDIGFLFEDTPISMREETDGKTIIPNNSNEKSFIRINATPQSNLSTFAEHLSTSGTVLHEVGHLIAKKILNDVDNDDKFKKLYEKEKNNITEINTYNGYAKKNPDEFFAEVFKSMVSMGNQNHHGDLYRESIKKEVPETVRFIEDNLKEHGYVLK
ncbi:anthrax toxin lethal factor-related metalloendopeptidase [Bacillus cereus]|uniref:ATLF-like domain-containing protein n=1 Tax=Bacillus cereus 03BB108 TaxID=451709 RepID=A0AAN0SQN4_BACCE|nr:hypothetical protein [Bacillus cereus]AJI08478.1 hypothetical protein AK40_5849 [Bacillus cereus 03BB108]QKG98842.1 hypothetical protein FOC96_00880 [Bacillus cereus]